MMLVFLFFLNLINYSMHFNEILYGKKYVENFEILINLFDMQV
jgi:hypothetical protein